MFDSDQQVVAEQTGIATQPLSLAVQNTDNQLDCLVIGPNEDRLHQLSQAAREAGWNTTTCDDTKSARTRMLRDQAQMAIIDLEDVRGSSPEELKKLVERFAKQLKNTLLVLCGNDGNAMEEIWARQLGVWLYLPGVAEDSDLGSLFEEAIDIASRKQAAAAAERYFTS